MALFQSQMKHAFYREGRFFLNTDMSKIIATFDRLASVF